MLHLSSHPLVGDCMAKLRDKRTEPDEFRTLSRKVITLLLYEATADLPVRRGTVETPLGPADASWMEQEIVAVAVPRGRRSSFNHLPPRGGKRPLLLAPMLATGGAGARAIDLIKEAGGLNSRFI